MSPKIKVKFVETDYNRLLDCQLAIINACTTRTGLIEVYRAAKNVIKSEDMPLIINACRERQTWLLEQGIISL